MWRCISSSTLSPFDSKRGCARVASRSVRQHTYLSQTAETGLPLVVLARCLCRATTNQISARRQHVHRRLVHDAASERPRSGQAFVATDSALNIACAAATAETDRAGRSTAGRCKAGKLTSAQDRKCGRRCCRPATSGARPKLLERPADWKRPAVQLAARRCPHPSEARRRHRAHFDAQPSASKLGRDACTRRRPMSTNPRAPLATRSNDTRAVLPVDTP